MAQAEEITRPLEQDLTDASALELTSTTEHQAENFTMSGDLATQAVVSYSNSVPGPSNNDDIVRDHEGRLYSAMDEDISSKPTKTGVSFGFRRNRSTLRSKQLQCRCVKPQTSLESCLMAQLYTERAKMEQYTYSTRTPWEPSFRPFIVADGSGIIARSSHEYCIKQLESGNYKLGKEKNSSCAPRLPNFAPVELQVRDKGKRVKKSITSQGSSSDGVLLFFLGLTMGITYSSLRQKQEIEKMRNSLKKMEELVQDLQEELEMKDASTMKELAVEDYEALHQHQQSLSVSSIFESLNVQNCSHFNDPMQALSPEQKLDCSPRNVNAEYCFRDSEEVSLSKIEAELEEELDRLASNMKSSSLDGKSSNAAEKLDTCFLSDVVQGDLRRNAARQSTSGGSSTTPRSAHYPISPRDLSLRLHQVVQSRLEERVRELESALEQSNRMHGSPFCGPDEPMDQPVVINLLGDALSGYNEVYDELAKQSESDEASLDNHTEQHLVLNKNSPKDVTGFGVVDQSNDGSEDERERLLIRQIVEKARQGSPAVLKAQRDLLMAE